MPDHRWFTREGDEGSTGSAGTPTDPATALNEIQNIMAGAAYRVPTHPFHREAVENVTRLYQVAYPE